MKLFDYETYEDFGKEFFLQILTSRRFALFDFTLQWDDFGSDEIFPAMSLSIGSSHLLGFFFRWNRFQFDCSIIDSKARDLEWYRRNSDD
jgi:hypothetical protein